MAREAQTRQPGLSPGAEAGRFGEAGGTRHCPGVTDVKTDAISIVEAAYDLEGDSRAWLQRLLDRAAPRLDRGFGVVATIYAPNLLPEALPFALRKMDDTVCQALLAMSVAHSDMYHRLNSGAPSGSVVRLLGMSAQEAGRWPPFVEFMHAHGIRDLTGIVARNPDGQAVGFTAPMPDLRGPTRKELSRWAKITAHISAGARLRRAFGSSKMDISAGADAILSPSGVLVHGQPRAQGPDAREELRCATKAIDRARSKARAREDEALDLWQALVAGRWSLVDRFDADGRRFIVAKRNDPQVRDPRALTLRERQVLAYAAMGNSLKLIAYTLGLSVGCVSGSRARAMGKLGLSTQAQLVETFAPKPRAGT
jgi:DNA-binding CsgD family transcriptional regulator